VTMEIGDGTALPYEDDQYDGAVVAFGIRNFPDRLEGLKEMRRVVKPGRKVVVLELSEPREGLLAKPAQLYIHHIVPRLGAAISGKKEYRYLQRSIEAFPDAPDFVALMQEAGLRDCEAIPMSFGAVHLFVGTV
jgi:demethylmenaquinone methyltransferase / 2-methoxy-6-polyprenyl-1,4-benzoquinol methylase